ncbi:hypothetical protein [Halobacillus sp. K22]
MGIFFKQMSESQIKNSRQGIYQGFYHSSAEDSLFKRRVEDRW